MEVERVPVRNGYLLQGKNNPLIVVEEKGTEGGGKVELCAIVRFIALRSY